MKDEQLEDDTLAAVDSELESMARLIRRAAALTPATLTPAELAEVQGVFSGSSRLSALERIDIYREQFWLRHHAALAEDFPSTSRLLGTRWPEIARGYLLAHPPQTPSLRELGFQLPEYLAGLGPSLVPSVALAMAELEVAYLEVFDVADEPPAATTRFADIPGERWPSVRLRFSNALRLLDLPHPVADLRRTLRSGGKFDGKSVSGPEYLAVYRRKLDLFDLALDRVAFDLLAHLRAGLSLGLACEATAVQTPDAAPLLDEHLGAWFSTWARLGWITDVVLPSD